MTDADKLAMLISMTGETDENVLSTFLTLAKNVVLAKAIPTATVQRKCP